MSLWGIVPEETTGAGISDLVSQWAELAEPGSSNRESGYPYVRSADENGGTKRGRATDLAELRTLSAENTSCMLGDIANDSPIIYQDLSVTVTAFGPDESYALAPAWYLWTESTQFQANGLDSGVAAQRAEQFVELTKRAHSRTGSVFTYGDTMSHPYGLDVHPNRDRLIARDLQQLYWLNVFDPAFADAIGRDRLLATGTYGCRGLLDGSVWLRVSGQPTERDVPERRRLLDALR